MALNDCDLPDRSTLLSVNGLIQLSLLGSGASGQVYACRSRTNPVNEVAVKMIPKNMGEGDNNHQAQIDELRIVRRIGKLSAHENIVRFYHDFHDAHFLCMVMEICCGGNLDSYLRQRKNQYVEEREALEIIRQVASGLEFLHKEGSIIHRDIKSANIMIKRIASSGTYNYKIGDFGFSRQLAPGEKAKTMLGTPLFMAPEVLMGKGYSFSADIWSLGCVLFNCLFGKRPFGGSNPKELLRSILSERGSSALMILPPYPHVSTGTHRLLSGLLFVRPASRLSLDNIHRRNIFLEKRGSQSTRGASPSSSTSYVFGKIWRLASGYVPMRSKLLELPNKSGTIARKRAFSDDYVVVDSPLASIPEAGDIIIGATKQRTRPTVEWNQRLSHCRMQMCCVTTLVQFADCAVRQAIIRKHSSRDRARLFARAGALYMHCLEQHLRPIMSLQEPSSDIYHEAFRFYEQILERLLQCSSESCPYYPEVVLVEVAHRILSYQ